MAAFPSRVVKVTAHEIQRESKNKRERKVAKDKEQEKEPEPSGLIGGVLNLFGLKIDVGELLASPEKLAGQLGELRENLKAAGGKEVLSEEEWRRGGATITGHIRTRGLLGDQEFHIGTMGRSRSREATRATSEPPEVVEPPTDVFDEAEGITIIADVPGVTLEEMELKLEGRDFSLVSKAPGRRNYLKELRLEADLDPDSLQAVCRNGVLEVRISKRGAEKGKGADGQGLKV